MMRFEKFLTPAFIVKHSKVTIESIEYKFKKKINVNHKKIVFFRKKITAQILLNRHLDNGKSSPSQLCKRIVYCL